MFEVFKFGGASVKDADGMRNVAAILARYPNRKLVVVISATGKTTNALEKVLQTFRNNGDYLSIWNEIQQNHRQIIEQLELNQEEALQLQLNALYADALLKLQTHGRDSYQWIYDQIISIGELLSTHIFSAYLSRLGRQNQLLDARSLLYTDNAHTEAGILWDQTEAAVKQIISQAPSNLLITQGFIGSAPDGSTTTLGREGSDYTAAVLSYCLQAASMTIWKDVPGVMNADPKAFEEACFIPELTYHEAIEMSYYGAKVIHPKTIKPLQNRNIPLEVRSFIQPEESGTFIKANANIDFLPPIMVVKQKQVLLSFSALDFSFIAEEHLSHLFGEFARQKLHINLMQNAAISFSVCVDDKPEKLQQLIHETRKSFAVTLYRDLSLITIRHHNDSVIQKMSVGKELLIRQYSRQTVQLLLR